MRNSYWGKREAVRVGVGLTCKLWGRSMGSWRQLFGLLCLSLLLEIS